MKSSSFRTQAVLFTLTLLLLGGAPPASARTRARIMAGNISSGSQQSYDPGEGIRMFQGLKPDVALIQEFNFKENTEDDLEEFVETAFGEDFHTCRDSKQSSSIPNGVVSRFEILTCGGFRDSQISNREYTYAKIKLPGGKNLWAFSLHLSNKEANKRVAEAQELVRYIRQTVPSTDYLVLGGDFNTRSRDEQAIRTLRQVVVESHVPVDSNGNSNTNASRRIPYDWVLANAALERLQVALQFPSPMGGMPREGHNLFTHGLVFDSRTFPALNLVPPIQKGDSGANGMQHMPVLKDFLLED